MADEVMFSIPENSFRLCSLPVLTTASSLQWFKMFLVDYVVLGRLKGCECNANLFVVLLVLGMIKSDCNWGNLMKLLAIKVLGIKSIYFRVLSPGDLSLSYSTGNGLFLKSIFK